MAGKAGRLTLALAALAAVGAGAATVDPVTALAGRYSREFENRLVSGVTYSDENIVEIVRVDADRAYVRMELSFFNNQRCGFAGIAERRGTALLYSGPGDDAYVHGQPCRLTIRRRGASLVWDDAGSCYSECQPGALSEGSLPWASKRPIRYLARLTGSEEYREAVKEWRGR